MPEHSSRSKCQNTLASTILISSIANLAESSQQHALRPLAFNETDGVERGARHNSPLPDAAARSAAKRLVDFSTVRLELGIPRLEPPLGVELAWPVEVAWRG